MKKPSHPTSVQETPCRHRDNRRSRVGGEVTAVQREKCGDKVKDTPAMENWIEVKDKFDGKQGGQYEVRKSTKHKYERTRAKVGDETARNIRDKSGTGSVAGSLTVARTDPIFIVQRVKKLAHSPNH